MYQRFVKMVRENSVVRFLLSHLMILLAALLICAVGFRSAFRIVRNDILDSTGFALTQAVSGVDNGLSELRTLGMQTSRSDSLYRLENLSHSDETYYPRIIRAIDEYYQRLAYYAPNWMGNTFIYLNGLDRVIYNRAIYAPNIFSNQLQEWGSDPAIWQERCTDENLSPYFCTMGGQDLYYGIPSSRLMSGKIATVFFRIEPDWLEDKFSFLTEYDAYSLFVLDGDSAETCLYTHDDLGLAQSLPGEWLTKQGTWSSGSNLVLHLAGSDVLGLSYLLVLPEQQAMRQLNTLRNQMLFLIFAAVVLGTAVSLYFSVRRGRPVNAIARALQADGAVNTDLNLISSAVSQLVQDNTHLLQEQAADRPALQTAFYHNLLKSNFVSRPEMEYMAQRAGIELTDKTYCAAVLRLFPGIDIDAIDGQTVEDAKVLQQAISAYVDELCVRPVHNYKRNTLETLYMFEIQDQEKLLGVLHRVAAWLHEQYHVEAHWGVGTPCDDLMQFWKSAEEAAAAQHDADGGTAVQVYGSQLGARDGYYFPYVVEERLTQSLRAGDAKAVEDVLSLLQTENFVRRSLNRSRMRQLNRRIVEILSAQTGVIVEENADLMALNELAFDYKGDCEPYFERLNTLCQALCSEVTQQKNARRSENVKAIEEYIRKNYHNPNLGLAMVSAEFNLSEGYLSAIFKKETGTNFAEYLEQLRVKAACVLLQDGCKVSDLPERLGYNSIQSFRRAFKRVMGVSPSEYRG